MSTATILLAIYAAAVTTVLVVALVLLHRIDEQFSTNQGHTLKDATNRIEDVTRELGCQLDRLAVTVGQVGATGLRIEEGAGTDRVLARGVAADLARAQSAVDDIADDVALRTARADNANDTPGEAGDAYGRSQPEP